MTFLEIFQLFGLATIFGALISGLVSHFLQKQRERENRIFNARRKVYAEVMEKLNYSYIDKNNPERDLGDPNFKMKMRIYLGETFSKARILASKKLSDKLRELYDVEIKTMIEAPATPELNEKRNKLTLETEALIRKDLGVKN